MLFLAACSEGFVRKLGEILSVAVSMWGAGPLQTGSGSGIWVVRLRLGFVRIPDDSSKQIKLSFPLILHFVRG